jgi:3-phenylpropionate/trans-cinnamate dioxygenase ferredoxin reductase component
MNTPGLVIVGSGPAGVSAAEAFRKHDPDTGVLLLTDDPALPYARPPLSKEFLRGDVEETDTELHPASWFDERAITVLASAEVTSIDVVHKTVTAGGVAHAYRTLVLAAGARPVSPPMPGGETALRLRSLSEAARLRKAATGAGSAVVIGGGFIGCEAAASLAMRGVVATVVAPDPLPQVKRIGDEAAERLAAMLAQAGARYVGGVAVESAEPGRVHLDNGVTIDCDVVLAALGVQPCSDVAEKAGIEVSDSRIVVDSGMRTSAEGVYAAGDVALAHNATAGRPIPTEHWQDAVDQGAVAGANAAGASDEWGAVPGFWSSIGEATLKYTGWGEDFDQAHFRPRGDGFTVWYETGGTLVGALTHDADDDYDRAAELIRTGWSIRERGLP